MEKEKPLLPLADAQPARLRDPGLPPAAGEEVVFHAEGLQPSQELPETKQEAEAGPENAVLVAFIEAITGGAALEAWGALPYLQRVRVRSLLEQLVTAFDTLDPRFGGIPEGESWRHAVAHEEVPADAEDDDLPFFFTVEQLARFHGVLPPLSAVPETHALHALAQEQAETQRTLAAAIDRIQQSESLNPDFA